MTERGKFLFGASVGAFLNIWPPFLGGHAAFAFPILFGCWAFYELLGYRKGDTDEPMVQEGLREALERLSKLTPFSANAATVEDFAATVHAIADTALSATPAQEGEETP